jgi:hypothetical protein
MITNAEEEAIYEKSLDETVNHDIWPDCPWPMPKSARAGPFAGTPA